MKIKIEIKILILFAIGAFFLILSWFRGGLIYGGGDVGLQTYNPQRIFEISRYIWWESIAPGLAVPQSLVALPFSLGFSILQYINFNPLLFQVTLFYLILLFMTCGIYLLLNSFIKEKKYILIGVFFYIFNPYMMIQVWHRFVHSTFFLVAALPFLILFWIFWIRHRRIIYLLGFLMINLVFLYAYGTIAYILTVWLFIFLFTLLEAILPWKGIKNASQFVILFIVGFVIWAITNIWWLVPVFNIAPGLLSIQHTSAESLTNLINLSKQSVIPFLIQMINPFYLFSQLDFGSFYLIFLVRMIPLILFGIIFVGIIKGLKIKEYSKWIILYLIMLFLAKGAASPLGYLFVWSFEHFFALGVLRNPFEKIGVILPLVSTVVLVIGIIELSNFLNTKKMIFLKNILILLVVTLIVIFCWPIFSGNIFGRIDNPEYVKVPQSYSDANNWLISDYKKDKIKNPGNILHLPLTRGESITYNWEYGYSGLESSALFFTAAPSISHGFNIKQIDDVLTSIYMSLNNSEYEEISLKLIQKLNIKYIILHKDVKWQGTDLIDPNETKKHLDKINFIKLVNQFGELEIYKVKDEYFESRIYFTNNFKLIYPGSISENNLFFWKYMRGADLIQLNQHDSNKKEFQVPTEIILPSHSFSYSQLSKSYIESFLSSLISNEVYENKRLETFSRARDTLKQYGEIKAVNKLDQILISDKKIIDIYKHINTKQVVSNSEIKDYENSLRQIFTGNISDSRLLLYLNNSDISKIFQSHLYIIRLIKNTSELEAFLEKSLLKDNLGLKYHLDNESSDKEGVAYLYEVPEDGVYDLVLKIDQGDESKDLINNQNIFIDGKKLSFVEINLNSGIHEVFIPSKNAKLNTPFFHKTYEPNKSIEPNDLFVSFDQNSPVNYSGHIKITHSNILIFSQTYHPGWKLTLRDQKGVYEVKKHFVSNFFGNAFLIDRIGEYEFNLIYEPQSIVDYGIILSIAMYIVLIIYYLLIERRGK